MQSWLRVSQGAAALGLVFLLAGACAKGDALDSFEEDGSGGSGDGGGRSSTGSKGSSSTGLSGPAQTTGTTSGPSGTTGTGTTTTTTGPTSTTTSTTNTSAAATTSSGMVVDCDPENPGPGCGAAQHCVPQTSGDPTCEAAGAGTAYALCPSGRSECAPVFECVFDGLDSCCMQWCQVGGGGAGCGALETCTSFNTPVYINGVEYGVCWDGLPCVI
ncbi:MAG: hypothetical protein JNL21_15765 [Myxococcales bacterium]|nr:hypothetical protein [Myxococcales bacterium]